MSESGQSASKIVPVRMPDGQIIQARVTVKATPEGPMDIGLGDWAQDLGDRVHDLAADSITRLIGSVARNLHTALDEYGADKVSADFGIELSAETGQLLGVLAQAGATANVTVHLTWSRPQAASTE